MFPEREAVFAPTNRSSPVDALLAQLAERVADSIVARLSMDATAHEDEWLDSRGAAAYLGIHRDTLRKLAAECAIPSEQDGPGCKRYFRRSGLDSWRDGGGRSVHLASSIADAA